MIQRILADFPQIEVLERILYKDYLCRLRLFTKLLKKKKVNKKNCRISSEYVWENLTNYIETLGINKGDIIIIHSDMNKLNRFGKTCEEIITYLFGLVGKEGTLVMPAFPYYKDKKSNGKPLFNEIDEEIRKYDPKRTYSWTGMLPNIMCTYQDAVRSAFPNNSLVAMGKDASAMMEHNLKGIYPHGKYSAWEYCVKHNARVLLLGVTAAKSFTGRHLAEDYLEEEWPIEGWYKTQHYQIKVDDKWVEKDIRVRKQFWSRYVTEYYSIKRLERAGLISETMIDNIRVGYVADIMAVRDFMLARVKEGDLTFYKIPKRYWRKK